MSLAIAGGAYAHHGSFDKIKRKKLERAVHYQTLGTLPLLFMKNVHAKHLPSAILLSGLAMFSGVLFYGTVTEDYRYNYLMPYGGVALIGGWFILSILA
jgi:uncharacterized membrane protein YgdD (TMEM256/DUF423 family)